MSEYRNFFFYLLFANIYIISHSIDRSLAIKVVFERVGIPYNLGYGGRLKYLTHITLSFQAAYFALCAINSLFEYSCNNNKPSQTRLRRFCNFLYTGVVWPAGVLVTITFWGLFFINRDLIYPKAIEEAIPHWQNHVMHTLPLITGLLDSYCTKHSYNPNFLKGVLPTLAFSLAYVVWIFVIAFHGGFWVYPVLKYLSTVYRILFISGLLGLVSIFYKSGETINNLFWPNKRLIVKKID